MNEISAHQGLGQFGPAYQVMFENDTHAPGSIDRILMEGMVGLCSATVDYLYGEHTPTSRFYQKGTWPVLERHMAKAVLGCHSDEERIGAIARFASDLKEKATDDLDLLRVGGTEEEIIAGVLIGARMWQELPVRSVRWPDFPPG